MHGSLFDLGYNTIAERVLNKENKITDLCFSISLYAFLSIINCVSLFCMNVIKINEKLL